MTQLDLLEYCAQARDAALAQVALNSDEWIERAYQALLEILPTLPPEFTPQMAKPLIIERAGEPRHFNAWGSLWMRAIRAGDIEATGRMGHSNELASKKTAAPYYRQCRC